MVDFAQLRELILLEEFKNCLPEKIVVYLNEQKADTVSKAAVLADEFVLTHRRAFAAVRGSSGLATTTKRHNLNTKNSSQIGPISCDGRECFYCHEKGHVISVCPALKRKEQNRSSKKPKSVGFIQSTPSVFPVVPVEREDKVEDSFRPFIFNGSVSLTGRDEDQVPITILYDTGANQSLLLRDVLPFTPSSYCGFDTMCSKDGGGNVKPSTENSGKSVDVNMFCFDDNLCLDVDRDEFVQAQQTDPTLASCLAAANSNEGSAPPYRIQNGVLVRHWFPPTQGDLGWNSVQQVLVPQKYRSHILSLSHDGLSGHLGIKKTYNLVLRHFFWLGLKSDVSRYCRSCHVCQLSSKPNQVISPAPLHPIPVMGEPFEHLIIDCVGPLPKTKAGYQYILTLMCAATCYPEAIPLRTLRAKAVVRALVNFFSTFGLPKSIQSDQGSNFTSKLFSQIISSLSIKHQKSSAYHPQSQGALERFHQTLKAMIKKFCLESGREWDGGLPFLMLATRESVYESTGFSPAELVFGHSVCGPLRLLKDRFVSDPDGSKLNSIDYVSSFRERLHKAREIAHSSLAVSQRKMKNAFDKKAVPRLF